LGRNVKQISVRFDEAHRVLDTIKDRLGMRIAVYEVAIKLGVIDQIS
jgi:hypothetical protein